MSLLTVLKRNSAQQTINISFLTEMESKRAPQTVMIIGRAVVVRKLLLWGSVFPLLVGYAGLRLNNLPVGEINASSNETGIDKIETVLVVINVSVTDRDNQTITDLRVKDFHIAEDDVPQEIAFLSRDESSVGFGLAFDISDYEPLKLMARQVARSFVSQIRSTDEVTIPQLKADSRIVQDFAADKQKLENALSEISSKNKLPDIIDEAVKYTTEKRKSRWPAMIVITDGLSLSGTDKDNDAAYAILREGTPIYFVILDDASYRSRLANQSRIRRTRNLLTRLAEVSGGHALVVKSEAEISAVTEKIIHRLKNQYTLGYYPTNEKHDGSFRYVNVRVTPKDKRKVKVSAPLGYYAPDPAKIREEKTDDK
jgi:Ca-activated chloride channel family protein